MGTLGSDVTVWNHLTIGLQHNSRELHVALADLKCMSHLQTSWVSEAIGQSYVKIYQNSKRLRHLLETWDHTYAQTPICNGEHTNTAKVLTIG